MVVFVGKGRSALAAAVCAVLVAISVAAAWAAAGPVPRVTLFPAGGAVTALAFPAGRGTLAVATARGVVQIWSLEPRDLRATLMDAGSWVACPPVPTGSTDFGNDGFENDGVGSAGPGNHGPTLLTLSRRGRLGVWSVDDPRPRRWHRHAGTMASLSADGRWLAASSGGVDVALLDMRVLSARGHILPTPGGIGAACTTALAVSPDGDRVAQALAAGAGARDAVDGAGGSGMVLIRDSGIGDAEVAGRVRARLPAAAAVRALAWSPDGRWLAAAGGVLQVWDAGTHRPVAGFERGLPGQVEVAFAPDGRLLASGDERGRVSLFDPATGAERAALNCRGGTITALAFSADDTLLACGTAAGTVTVWDKWGQTTFFRFTI